METHQDQGKGAVALTRDWARPALECLRASCGSMNWQWPATVIEDLRFFIQKTKIMASGPIISWQIDGERMKIVTDFIFLGSKITVEDCSHEIKRCLLLGWKVMTNLDSILKSRDIILPTKVRLVKAMVVLYRCESWIRKKAEHQKTDASELWC